MRYLWSIVVLAIAFACTSAQAPAPNIDIDAERASLIEADEDWNAAYGAADDPMEAFVARIEDDGVLLAPDAPLAKGHEAIRAVLAPLADAEIHWKPTTAEVAASADLGHTIGTYEMTMKGPDGNLVRIEGKYLTVWRKQADGSWKVAADTFNPNGPPTPVEEE
jgi:ketosteroid isomerase-like protein